LISIFLLAETSGLLEKFPSCTVEFFQRSFLPHGYHYCWYILCSSCSVRSFLYQRQGITVPASYCHIALEKESVTEKYVVKKYMNVTRMELMWDGNLLYIS
jgi:hypothetical protein